MTAPSVNHAFKSTEVFAPIKVGQNEFQHRIVHAPTTRFRALPDHSPSNLSLRYYDSRTKTKGSYIISEATTVSPEGSGYANVPGIWTDAHVKAWKKITDKVHENGSFIGAQVWHLGRAADPAFLKSIGQDFVAPSPLYQSEASEKTAIENGIPLRALTKEEIHHLARTVFPTAARNAIEAGFDYFELHGAHGFLVDTFLNPSSNKRTDEYGGSIENRARFLLETIDALIDAIGADKVAIRLSPWAVSYGMKALGEDVHPVVTIGYVLNQLQKRADDGKQLAYISIVEPRASADPEAQLENNDFASQIWKGILLKSGNYTYDAPRFETLQKDVENGRTLVGFSRYFTSNPDFVDRLYHGFPLEEYDRTTFYDRTNWGYNTFNRHGDSTVYNEKDERKVLPEEIAVKAE